MTREDYIKAVKAKLDEISPFDEPNNFIAADGDPDYDEVKPIVSFIDDSLDKAVWYCLNNLPLTLLAKDITKFETTATLDKKGVGHIAGIDEYWRLVRLHDNADFLERDVTVFISTADPIYLLQQNAHTRGGCCKPVVAYSPDTSELEIYSYPASCGCNCDKDRTITLPIILYYIDCHIKAENVLSSIEDFIVLTCASYVEEILGDATAAKVFQTEYNNKQTTVLQ